MPHKIGRIFSTEKWHDALLLSQDQDDKEVAKQLLSSPQKRAERNKEVK
jgi:hypothetical protein